MENIVKLIAEECKKCTGVNPIKIFDEVAGKDFVRIHGPEHHVLDGACILAAYRNAGGIKCRFSGKKQQCIAGRCPYHDSGIPTLKL